MPRGALLFVLFLAVCLAAQDRKVYHIENVPGSLETALSQGQQSVVRHELGSLTPPGVVRLFAVAAFDKSTKQTTKGLEVQLEGDDIWNGNRHCKTSAYIDEDGLADFEQRLTSLVASERSDMSDPQGWRSEIPSVVLAANTADGQPKNGVFYVPVQFGFYWTGSRFGVYADSPYGRPSYSRPVTASGCQFNMPEADISELLPLVRDGREWLRKEAPSAEVSDATRNGER
jgi:hypothetical protein